MSRVFYWSVRVATGLSSKSVHKQANQLLHSYKWKKRTAQICLLVSGEFGTWVIFSSSQTVLQTRTVHLFFNTCWTHPNFTLNSYPIMISPYCFLVASLILFFFCSYCSSASSPIAETGTSVRAPLPLLHLALYFSDRVRSTEVTVCISSISVRQQYNRAEERHVNWE